MDSYSLSLGMKQACLLFVPQIKDSHICGVCHFTLNDHSRTSLPYSVSNKPVYVSVAELPRTATISPISKPQPVLLNSLPSTVHNSPRASHKSLLTQSETSAFTKYSKSSSSNQSISSSEIPLSPRQNTNSIDGEKNGDPYQLRKCRTFSNSAAVVKPKPRYLKPFEHNDKSPLYLMQIPVERIEDNDAKEDRSPSLVYRRIRTKQKERSCSASRSIPSPPSEPCDNERRELSVIVPKETVPRAHNFKQILDRFQKNAREHVMRENNSRSVRARDPNRRFTVDSFPIEDNSTNERLMHEKAHNPPSLTISIPAIKAPQRRPLPDQWVRIKETDIDDIPQTPALSESSISPPSPALRTIPVLLEDNTSQSSHKMKHKLEGNERQKSNEMHKENAIIRLRERSTRNLARERPYSQSELGSNESTTSTTAILGKKLQSPVRTSLTVSMPISDEGGSDSPVPCVPSPSRSSLTPQSHPPPTPITSHRAKTIDEAYNQMTLNHRESLAYVAEHLADYIRSRDVPITNEKFNQLKFGDILFKSFTPTLTKGASIFFDASIPRDGQLNYDITLMIAPASQYYPLSIGRPSMNTMLYHPPVLVEIEDNSGEVRRFLQDSSHLSGRTYKAFIMPRLTLLSFHSLAAHGFDRRMGAEIYERHVCFIMMQLVCALKSLQSDGIEQLSNNFNEFLLAYRTTNFNITLDTFEYPRIMLLRETISEDLEESKRGNVGVCKYALRALCTLLHHKMDNGVPRIVQRSSYSDALLICAQLLNEEKSSSLSDAKNILEYSFWLGSNTEFENEFDAKIWLDAQRARDIDRLLHAFINDSNSLNETTERLRVQFLLSVTPRSLFTSCNMLHNSYC